jgi:hypothetical protein
MASRPESPSGSRGVEPTLRFHIYNVDGFQPEKEKLAKSAPSFVGVNTGAAAAVAGTAAEAGAEAAAGLDDGAAVAVDEGPAAEAAAGAGLDNSAAPAAPLKCTGQMAMRAAQERQASPETPETPERQERQERKFLSCRPKCQWSKDRIFSGPFPT